MRLEGIAAELVDTAWPLVEHWINRATDQSPHFSPEDIREACKTRDMCLWALMDGKGVVGAVVTQVVICPQVKLGRLVAAACADGYRDGWLPLRSVIEEWARSYGCELMVAEGRPGWARLVPDAKHYALLEWRI